MKGAALDGYAIKRVYDAHKARVRRACWTPAFAARASVEHSSARIRATVTIATSGDVTNVVVFGDVGAYPGISDCLASRIQTWKFPKGGDGPVTATMPFDLYGPP